MLTSLGFQFSHLWKEIRKSIFDSQWPWVALPYHTMHHHHTCVSILSLSLEKSLMFEQNSVSTWSNSASEVHVLCHEIFPWPLVPIWCANLSGHSGCPKSVGHRALHTPCTCVDLSAWMPSKQAQRRASTTLSKDTLDSAGLPSRAALTLIPIPAGSWGVL